MHAIEAHLAQHGDGGNILGKILCIINVSYIKKIECIKYVIKMVLIL